jgi:inhibitor of cysteine peptidase
MKIFKQIIGMCLVVGLAICLMGQLGCPTIPSGPTNGENVTTQEIKVNQSFMIALESNPTTGYSWEADFDQEYLSLAEPEYITDQPEMIGSGGVEKFTFTGLKAGVTEITMNYKRPWEEKSIETQVFKVTIESGQ